MNKKLQALLLMLTALLLIASACSTANEPAENTGNASPSANTNSSDNPPDPLGKYEEEVTISIGMEIDPTDTSLPPGDSPLDNQYTRHIKENLNIKVEHAFTASAANMPQKISLAIASNDLPDALVVDPIELRQMVEAGQLADLTDVYEQYLSPGIKKIIEGTGGSALKAVTFDGKIMAIPAVQLKADGIHLMWIRKDWLDKLGLEPPKTIEELENVARAFVEQDPDGNGQKDTIGISGPQSGNGKMYANFLESKNNLYGFDPIFAAFGAYPGFWMEGDDGQPVYGSIQPATKEALIKLNELYAAGLIDPEMAVRKDSKEPIVAGKAGIFFAPWWMGYGPISEAIQNDPTANWQAYALPLNADGKFRPSLGTPSSDFLVVRKGYEHPEAAIKILNNLLKTDSEATFDPSKGGPGLYPLRLVYAPSDETEYTVKAIREVLAGTKTPEDYDGDTEYKLLASDLRNITKVKKEPYDQLDIETWDPAADMGVWTRAYSVMVGGTPLVDNEIDGVPSLIYEQTPLMENRWVNLKKMEDEMFLKIVMGVASPDTFEQFVNDWKAQGGDQITQEVADIVNQQ